MSTFTQEMADNAKECIQRQVGKEVVTAEFQQDIQDLCMPDGVFTTRVLGGDAELRLKWTGPVEVSRNRPKAPPPPPPPPAPKQCCCCCNCRR